MSVPYYRVRYGVVGAEVLVKTFPLLVSLVGGLPF